MPTTFRSGFHGTGPGDFSPDGCAIELYRRLPVGDAPELIAAAVPAGASVLELGCGVGRITHPLLARGFRVTAVDESAPMLAQVTGARTVCSRIEDLDLGETFDIVLLMSYLVHAPEPALRRALLDACHRHLTGDGVLLIQRQGSDWHHRLPRQAPLADGLVRVVSSVPDGAGVRAVLVEYEFPDATWTQAFITHPMGVHELTRTLAESGLAIERQLTEDGEWLLARRSDRAVPAGTGGAGSGGPPAVGCRRDVHG